MGRWALALCHRTSGSAVSIPELTAQENAIYDWVLAASELPETQVFWAHFIDTIPDGVYICLTWGDSDDVGSSFSRISEDSPGITTYTTTTHETQELTIECFAGNVPWNEAKPQRRLQTVMRRLNLPIHYEALSAAGVGFGTKEKVQALESARSSVFEARALINMTIHLVATESQTISTIDTVEVEGTISMVTGGDEIGNTFTVGYTEGAADVTLGDVTATGHGDP